MRRASRMRKNQNGRRRHLKALRENGFRHRVDRNEGGVDMQKNVKLPKIVDKKRSEVITLRIKRIGRRCVPGRIGASL